MKYFSLIYLFPTYIPFWILLCISSRYASWINQLPLCTHLETPQNMSYRRQIILFLHHEAYYFSIPQYMLQIVI